MSKDDSDQVIVEFVTESTGELITEVTFPRSVWDSIVAAADHAGLTLTEFILEAIRNETKRSDHPV